MASSKRKTKLHILVCVMSSIMLINCAAASEAYNLQWKLGSSEKLQYKVSRSVVRSINSHGDGYFSFPKEIQYFVVVNRNTENPEFFSTKKIIQSIFFDDSYGEIPEVAISLESAFLGEPTIVMEGMKSAEITYNSSGKLLRLDSEKKLNDAGWDNDILSDEMVRQLQGFGKKSLDYIFLLDAIFVQLPTSPVRIGDKWKIKGACNREGYLLLKNTENRNFTRKSQISFIDVERNDYGREIAILEYQYYERYVVSHGEDTTVASCEYSGVHYFDVENGRWIKIEGEFVTKYPDFVGLPKTQKIVFTPTQEDSVKVKTGIEIENIKQKYRDYKFTFPIRIVE